MNEERPTHEQILELIAVTHFRYCMGSYPEDMSPWVAEFVANGAGMLNALNGWRAERARHGDPERIEYASRWFFGDVARCSRADTRTLAVYDAIAMREQQRRNDQEVNAVAVYRWIPQWAVLAMPRGAEPSR